MSPSLLERYACAEGAFDGNEAASQALVNADFTGASLVGADLSGVDASQASFMNADLRNAIETLQRSVRRGRG